ncbi:MAG TPA: hypothetical protein VFW96_10460 [Thermomicrobiales bacterium]|nr:hypothetical protein [Thermomicrobiales bacterium]
MAPAHRSTAVERAQYVRQMFAHRGEYGFVTGLSRAVGVSRQTLYTWAARGEQALLAAFAPAAVEAAPAPLARQILTLYVETHASYRGVQRALREVTGRAVSLAAIGAVVTAAMAQARHWLATHQPATARAVALDELYGNNRHGAYLHVVDVGSGAVWWAEGPLPVDGETWALVLWEAEARGLRWAEAVTDGAGGMAQACAIVAPQVAVQRDVWHVLQRCAQVQGRLDREVAAQQARQAAVERQAARVAAGAAPLGRNPQTDAQARAAEVALARRAAADVRFLTQELRRLLEVVVLDARGLLTLAQRQAELEATLALLAEVAAAAPAAGQREVQRLHKHLTQALPGLLVFAARLARVERDWQAVLPPAQQALLAWAWQRRAALGVASAALSTWLPEAYRQAAQVLLHAWDTAVRVSSAVERWHSLLRPHLAVHRTLSSGLLALLAVWHNHRVFPRGDHQGQSPLHLSGLAEAPTDWLTALGYPPGAPAPPPLLRQHATSARTAVAA